MDEITISTIAFALCMAPGILHSIEVVYPMLVWWVVNWVLPLFAPGLPKSSLFLTSEEQTVMLDAALEASPKEKKTAGEDYIFVLLFEQCFQLILLVYFVLLVKMEKELEEQRLWLLKIQICIDHIQ